MKRIGSRRHGAFGSSIALRLAASLGAALLVLACGGGDEDDQPPPQEEPEDQTLSGLPADKAATELTATEAQELCKAYTTHMDTQIPDEVKEKGGCALGALTKGAISDVAACEASVEQCLSNGGGVSLTPPAASCTTDENSLTACDATVSEIEACFLAAAEVSKGFYASLNCQTLIDALTTGNASGFPSPATPEACTSLQSKCAAFTGG